MAAALVVGEALVDVVVRDGEPPREHPGGSPLNVAIGLARLGRRTRLLTRVGSDARGRSLLDHLAASGAEVVEGSVVDGPTSTAQARLRGDGAADYTFDITWELPAGADDVLAALAERDGGVPDVVHTGSIGVSLEPGASQVSALMDRFRATSTLSLDPNVRPVLVGDADPLRARVDALVAGCDVVKLSDEDAAWLAPGRAPEELLRRWLPRPGDGAGSLAAGGADGADGAPPAGPAVLVLTRGGDGLVGLCRAGRVAVPAPAVAVADTVGAGDSVMAALLDGLAALDLLGAAARGRLAAITTAQLESVLAHAAAVAAITVSRPGADPPRREELAGARA